LNKIKNDNLLAYLGFEALDENSRRLEIHVNRNLLNDDQTIHSGVFSTMLDTAIGFYISKNCNGFATTAQLNCSFFDINYKESYSSSASIVNIDGKLVTGEGIIYDQAGKMVAKGVGTFKVV
jgi:uncharacterized protein (TIGR00369 family)